MLRGFCAGWSPRSLQDVRLGDAERVVVLSERTPSFLKGHRDLADWAFGYLFCDTISYRVSIGYPRASQGITSITVELPGWLKQKAALEKLEIVKYGAKRVSEPPKSVVRMRGALGHTAGLCGRSIDTTTTLPSPCVSFLTLQPPDTHDLAQYNK